MAVLGILVLTSLAMGGATEEKCLGGDALACERVDSPRAMQTQLASRCDDGAGAACITLAHMLGGGRDKLPSKARRRALQGCESLGDGCVDQADAWLRGDGAPRDVALAMVLLEALCEEDNGQGCHLLAGALDGRGKTDAWEITDRYRKGCREHSADACLALAVRTREGVGAIRDPLKGSHFFDTACRLEAHEGCWLSARAWAEGDGVPRDQSQAWDRLWEACLIHTPRCVEAAEAFRAGEWLYPETEHIIQLYEHACDKGDDASCWTLHDLLMAGDEVPAQPFRASRMRAKACQDAEACAASVARLSEAGDEAEARLVLEAGCTAGHAPLCTDLGDHATTVEPVDLELASSTWLVLCDTHADASGCTAYGEALLDGAGVEADEEAGLELLRATCNDGHDPACEPVVKRARRWELASLTESLCNSRDTLCWHQGLHLLQGSRRGHPQAVELLERACTAESPSGCFWLGSAVGQGQGVVADPERGVQLYTRACELGEARACELLGISAPTGE